MSLEDFKKTEVGDRLTSESPEFFKKLTNYALIIGIVVPAVMGSIMSAGITVPLWIVIVAGTITSICGGVAGTAKLTKK